MAALATEMVCEVGAQTALRPIALQLMEDNPDLTKAHFPGIHPIVWSRRLGHAVTHLDSKVARWSRLVTQFREQPNTSKAETLARVLALTHALYWTASIHEDELLNKDTLRVWMTGTPEEACELVRKMSRRNEARLERKDPSFSTKRHGVSGLPLCAPHPSILPSRV